MIVYAIVVICLLVIGGYLIAMSDWLLDKLDAWLYRKMFK